MSLKKWFRLYGITLLIGVVILTISGFVRYLFDAQFVDQIFVSDMSYALEMLIFFAFLILFGSIYGTFSHIMFFCFLVLNLLGRGVVQYRFLWQGMQLIVVVSLVGINLGYLKGMYIAATIIIISAFVVAYYKSKLTNFTAFIPTFFFMSIGTFLAMVPTWSSEKEMLFILPTVLVCNSWQMMELHRVVRKEADETTDVNEQPPTHDKRKQSG